MAKSRSILKLEGTIGDLTFVRSRAYGDHVRAKRGTYTKIKVNKAFKAQSSILQQANVPSSVIKNAIDPYRGILNDGTMWSRLGSFFQKEIKGGKPIDFSALQRFEVHRTYTLHHLLPVQSTITPDVEKSLLRVTIEYPAHPGFTKVESVDDYKLTVITIYPDMKNKTSHTAVVESSILGPAKPVVPFEAELAIPKKATDYVVFLKIEGYINGKPANMLSTSGLCAIGGGRI